MLELRAERVERALWIDERLVKLDSEGLGSEESGTDGEGEESEEEELSRRMGREVRLD